MHVGLEESGDRAVPSSQPVRTPPHSSDMIDTLMSVGSLLTHGKQCET